MRWMYHHPIPLFKKYLVSPKTGHFDKLSVSPAQAGGLFVIDSVWET